jgi:membrane protease YdiL (CAAX protease family)
MHASAALPLVVEDQPARLSTRRTWALAIVCLFAGIAPFATHWIADDVTRIVCGLVLAAVYLGCTLRVRNSASLRPFWELSFAFFVLAVFLVLDNSIPAYIATSVLHSPPNSGNPFASTISGTVVVQVLETFFGVALVIASTLVTGRGLASVYARPGKRGRWLVVAVIFFVALYVLLATLPLRPDSPAQRLLPTNGMVTFDRLLTFTPALLVISLANGFEEEFVARGLFLQKYDVFFGARIANVLQAVVFASAHAGVTYTPSALLFILVFVIPLGLFGGYVMRATNGVLVGSIFHGALDMAIYLPFLSFTA